LTKTSSDKTCAKRTEDVCAGWGTIKRKHISLLSLNIMKFVFEKILARA
jgi:hypothetical protein